MGLCLNSNLEMPNLWKYTLLHSLAYLKLKKVNVFFPFLEAARRGGGWNLATSQENSNKTKRKKKQGIDATVKAGEYKISSWILQ